MIDHLLDAYRLNIYNLQKRKLKEFTKKEWLYLSLFVLAGVVMCILMIFFYEIVWVYSITFLGLVLAAIIIFSMLIRDSIKNYSNSLKGYKEKLGKLRETISSTEFDLYSQEKLNNLIRICDEKLSQKDLFSKLFEPIVRVFSTSIFPIITFVFGLLANQMNTQNILEYSILMIVVILYLTGVFYMIYPLLESSINKERHVLKSLRDELNDIIMIDFLN